MKHLRKFESFQNSKNSEFITESLNKDIKDFGKDLDNRLKSMGFKTLILLSREPSVEEKKKVK